MSAESHTTNQNFKWVVVIPTYNNARKILPVVQDSLNIAEHVMVFNDGCTDNTEELLAPYMDRLIYMKQEPNQGKGTALKAAFRKLEEMGFDYAITLDSDGQHQPKDIPKFIDRIAEKPNSIIIGARNMNVEGVPAKSSFGHKFSNFWFRVETGISLADTQTGYRLYPLGLMNKIKTFTKRYEYELEILVKSAWKGINIETVHIDVLYPTGEDRISHFIPAKDFTKISFLNTYFVILAFLYYRPLLWFRAIKKKSLEKYGATIFWAWMTPMQ